MHVLVLSPHRDDAAFSCGLILHALLVSEASITILNVCTVSSYAPYLTEELDIEGDTTTDRVTSVRRQEDQAFIECLVRSSDSPASAMSLVDVAWKDLPLRWQLEDQHVLDPIALPVEEVERLSQQMQALPSAELIFAPLALGGHVDHRLVHQAALRAFSPERLIFYEDLPYASRLSKADRAIADQAMLALGRPCVQPGASTPGLKRQFALCYPSQIAAEVAEEIENYGKRLGGRERVIGTSEALHQLELQLKKTRVVEQA